MPQGAVPFPFGKCRICNDKATGVHYGVPTCEGCKGFYKRSIPKGDKYTCYFGGSCDISPENRNRCKACRFRKCLSLGMAVEAVKMGRIPKIEKEKALEEAAALTENSGYQQHFEQFATGKGKGSLTTRDIQENATTGDVPKSFTTGDVQKTFINDGAQGKFSTDNGQRKFTTGYNRENVNTANTQGNCAACDDLENFTISRNFTIGSVQGNFTTGCVQGNFATDNVQGNFTSCNSQGDSTTDNIQGNFTTGEGPGNLTSANGQGNFTNDVVQENTKMKHLGATLPPNSFPVSLQSQATMKEHSTESGSTHPPACTDTSGLHHSSSVQCSASGLSVLSLGSQLIHHENSLHRIVQSAPCSTSQLNQHENNTCQTFFNAEKVEDAKPELGFPRTSNSSNMDYFTNGGGTFSFKNKTALHQKSGPLHLQSCHLENRQDSGSMARSLQGSYKQMSVQGGESEAACTAVTSHLKGIYFPGDVHMSVVDQTTLVRDYISEDAGQTQFVQSCNTSKKDFSRAVPNSVQQNDKLLCHSHETDSTRELHVTQGPDPHCQAGMSVIPEEGKSNLHDCGKDEAVGDQVSLSPGLVKMLFQQALEGEGEHQDKQLHTADRFSSSMDTRDASDTTTGLHPSIVSSSPSALQPTFSCHATSSCSDALLYQSVYTLPRCLASSLCTTVGISKDSSAASSRENHTFSVNDSGTISSAEGCKSSASLGCVTSSSQTGFSSASGDLVSSYPSTSLTREDFFTEVNKNCQMLQPGKTGLESVVQYGMSGRVDSRSEQDDLLLQAVCSANVTILHSGAQSLSQARPAASSLSTQFEAAADPTPPSMNPSASDNTSSLADEFFSLLSSERSSCDGQSLVSSSGLSPQTHAGTTSPSAYPNAPSTPLGKSQHGSVYHQLCSQSSTSPSFSSQEDIFLSGGNLVDMVCSASESESCSLDMNYLCPEEFPTQSELSRVNSENNSAVVSTEMWEMCLDPNSLSDPCMKEAVVVLDKNTYVIFDLAARRKHRDKYLKLKREDQTASGPPTTSSHLEMYPLLMEAMAKVNHRIINFCQVVPGFASLDTSDQKTLLKTAYYDIWMLTSSEFFVDGESYLIVSERMFYVRRHMEKIIGVSHTETFHRFAEQFNALGLSHLEVAIMCCIQLTATGNDQPRALQDVESVQKLHSFYLDLLIAVVTLIHPDSCSRLLVDIFRMVPLLVEINRLQRELIAAFSINHPPQDASDTTAAADVSGEMDDSA